MKVINKNAEKHYEQVLTNLENQKPKPLELTMHPENESPKTLSNNSIVMAGDYYWDDGESSIIIASSDIGENGAWRVVEST